MALRARAGAEGQPRTNSPAGALRAKLARASSEICHNRAAFSGRAHTPRRREGCRLPKLGLVAVLEMAAGDTHEQREGAGEHRGPHGAIPLVHHLVEPAYRSPVPLPSGRPLMTDRSLALGEITGASVIP